jgi:hypothetical protein
MPVRPPVYLVIFPLALCFSNTCHAQDIHSPKAQKIITTLENMGINNHYIFSLVDTVDERVKDKYFTLGEEQIAGGSLKFGYSLESGFHPGDPELRFTPEDSNSSYIAHRDGVGYSYKLKF